MSDVKSWGSLIMFFFKVTFL